jgi:hypothetical protein
VQCASFLAVVVVHGGGVAAAAAKRAFSRVFTGTSGISSYIVYMDEYFISNLLSSS